MTPQDSQQGNAITNLPSAPSGPLKEQAPWQAGRQLTVNSKYSTAVAPNSNSMVFNSMKQHCAALQLGCTACTRDADG